MTKKRKLFWNFSVISSVFGLSVISAGCNHNHNHDDDNDDHNDSDHSHQAVDKKNIGNLIFYKDSLENTAKNITVQEFNKKYNEEIKNNEKLTLQEQSKNIIAFLKKYFRIEGEVNTNEFLYIFERDIGHSHSSNDYHIVFTLKNVKTDTTVKQNFVFEGFKKD
ncbi:hypothetical protein [Mycoplasmopsis adleri]|uniref:hypothetical protein n=1 Tax=Mycoplasmopsis adleri TaxID=51362 RepID=UPI003872E09F